LAGSLHFGVCDMPFVARIASTAANKLLWMNCPDKTHYCSQYNLRNSAFFLFKVATINCLFSKNRLRALIFKLPASAKLAVKYRTGHLATLRWVCKSAFARVKVSEATISDWRVCCEAKVGNKVKQSDIFILCLYCRIESVVKMLIVKLLIIVYDCVKLSIVLVSLHSLFSHLFS